MKLERRSVGGSAPTGEQIRLRTFAGFAPLFARTADAGECAAQLRLLDSADFCGNPRLRWPLLPSTSPAEPWRSSRTSTGGVLVWPGYRLAAVAVTDRARLRGPGGRTAPRLAANIRISDEGHQVLKELASREGVPMGTVLERALERYRREKFLDDVNASYAALKANPQEWSDEMAERTLWENTLGDDLGEK